ncbi:MAG: DNA-directed RNA polymerase subunit omega [Candidatus Marinimicrobia bacterium]|nr:DNA-directed RNA polymerase subunit omega [Candidatus Neomarinimicrobiota bacterium]
MTDTLDISKLTEQNEDLFELVVAASKRSRQINALRIARDPLPSLSEDQEETFDETPDEEELRDWDKIEKPTTVALNEMLRGDLDYRHTSEKIETEDEEVDIASDIQE